MSAPSSPAPPAKSRAWGTAALVFAAVTIVAPVLIATFFVSEATGDPNRPQDQEGLGRLLVLVAGAVLAFLVAGLTGLLGTAAGVVALVRREPGAWRSVVGLIVNAPAALLLLAVVATWINGD